MEKRLRIATWLVLILLVASVVLDDDDDADPPPATADQVVEPVAETLDDADLEPWRPDEARARLARNVAAGELVTHAEWVDRSIFWLFMLTTEPKDYDAVAASFCRPLRLLGIDDAVVVAIYDAGAAARREMRRLGRAACR